MYRTIHGQRSYWFYAAIALVCLTVGRAFGAEYFIGPAGKDTNPGTRAAPFATVTKVYGLMKAGDTATLLAGQYSGLSVLSRTSYPPAGVTIRGEVPGGVVIDGKGTMSPISMDGPGASPIGGFTIQDIVFRHQAYGASLYGVTKVKFIRCGFEDASNGNSMAFNASKTCDTILLEDCFAWGSGRYKFSTYHASNVIFRRCVVRFDRVQATPDPMACFAIYASTNVQVQNCIALDGDQPSFWTKVDEYSGAFSTPSTDGPSTNVLYTGCIALNNAFQFGTLTKNLTNVRFVNCVGWHIQEGVWARDGGLYDHMTFGDLYGPSRQTSSVGLRFEWGDDPNPVTRITNSVISGVKGVALWGWTGEDYNVFSGNQTDRTNTPVGSRSVNAAPGLKYLVRGSDSATLKGKASDGGDIGATILKRIGKSGTFYGEAGYDQAQAEDLWPWPNEDVIRSYMRSYASPSGNRGFCADGKTLTTYVLGYLGNAPFVGSTPVPDPVPDPATQPTTVPTPPATQPSDEVLALRAQVTSLQVQLDLAKMDLEAAKTSINSLTVNITILNGRIAAATAELDLAKAKLLGQ